MQDADLPLLVGIDVGTQSIRAIAFDARGHKVAAAQQPTPVSGNEYDPDTIFATVLGVLSEIGRALDGRPVAGLAVASLGESCVLVDAKGRALGPSIVWHDRRTEPQARAISEAIGADRLFQITGHSIDLIFTLSKLAWMREHRPDMLKAARRILMMADWVAYRLSGEAATDPTLASRTLYFDLRKRDWSEEMLSLVRLDGSVLPPIAPSGTALGPVKADVLAQTGIGGRPIVGVGGHDHLVGSYAAGVHAPGTVLDSLGTAEAMLLNTAAPVEDPEILRGGYFQGAVGTGGAFYLGGGIYNSGGGIEWLRRVLGGVDHAALIAEAAAVPAGSGGVVFLPLLGGSAPPFPDGAPRGAFLGLTPDTTRGALFRAMLEGLALQARLMLDGMAGLSSVTPPTEIRVIGGGSRNELFLKIKANAFERPITVIDEAEASALGAALLGGVAAGLWPDLATAYRGLDRREHVVAPDEDASRYAELRATVFEHLHGAVTPINARVAEFAGGSG